MPRGCVVRVMVLALSVATVATACAPAWQQHVRSAVEASKQGRLEDAEGFWLAAVKDAEAAGDPKLALILNELGLVYLKRHKYADAEAAIRRALTIVEGHLGSGHPETSVFLDNLAVVYARWGRYSDAEPLHRRALTIAGKVPPTYSHAFAPPLELPRALLNLGWVTYEWQGRYVEAERLFKRLVALVELENSPRIVRGLYAMAVLYIKWDRLSEAEPLLGRALAIAEGIPGMEGTEAIATLWTYLGKLYAAQRRYAEAESLLRRALEIHERTGGLWLSLQALGELYRAQGKYAAAEPLLQRALAVRERDYGTEHPRVAETLNSLGELYRAQGRFAEAEPLFRRALAIRESRLGSQHPDIAETLEDYGALLSAIGQDAKAAELRARAAVIRAEHQQRNRK